MPCMRMCVDWAGFGAVCTLATWYWSFFTQAAVMNMVYPLFILVAVKSNPQKVYQKGEWNPGRASAVIEPMRL